MGITDLSIVFDHHFIVGFRSSQASWHPRADSVVIGSYPSTGGLPTYSDIYGEERHGSQSDEDVEEVALFADGHVEIFGLRSTDSIAHFSMPGVNIVTNNVPNSDGSCLLVVGMNSRATTWRGKLF